MEADIKLTEEQKKSLDNLSTHLRGIAEAGHAVAQSVTDMLNGLPIEHEHKIDRCRGCIFKSEYQDMGASTPICTIERFDLVEAVKLAEAQGPCEHKLTYEEARAYALNRNINKSTPE